MVCSRLNNEPAGLGRFGCHCSNCLQRHAYERSSILYGHEIPLLLPLVEQSLAILVDDFYLHVARGVSPAAFSCLFVIKEEFVDADVCALAQHVHAVLFVVHPLLFAVLALLRSLYHAPAGAIVWLEQVRGRASALPIQAAFLTLYMIYQAVYWNRIWKAPATEFEARQ